MISYKHADTALAQEVAAHLRAGGFDVWIDNKIRTGKDWRNEIAEAIQVGGEALRRRVGGCMNGSVCFQPNKRSVAMTYVLAVMGFDVWRAWCVALFLF